MKVLLFIITCFIIQNIQAQIALSNEYLDNITKELSTVWPKNRTINLVFHGHSVPSGYFVTPDVHSFDAYPMLTLKYLKERYPFAVINCITTAIGGENSEKGAARFEKDVLCMKPDVLFIDYALNDRGIGLERARSAWIKMIEMALSYRCKIILMTPTPDQKVDILNDSTDLAKQSQQIRALAETYHLGLIDSYLAFKNLKQAGRSIPEFMSQVNHPNAIGHKVVSDEILKWFHVKIWTQLRSEFANPSLKYRPVPLWFWNNTEVTKQGIEYQLKAMRDSCGYGGVSILPFGKEFKPEYLTDAYFDLYRFVIDKASELGMRICIYDEYGFPSGSGGWKNGDGRSRFGEKNPELLLKGLDKKEFKVEPGKECRIPVKTKGKIMGIVAMEQGKLDCVDITSSMRDSVVTWKVPKGEWRIMVFSCSYSGVPIADYLSEEATGKFISMTHQVYYEKFSKYFGNTVYGTFFDEPTLYHANGRVWTDGYNLKFENKYGFSPVKYYPALWYNIGDKTAAARNLLFGFRTELYAKGFTRTIDDWNRKYGIVATGHQDNEEVENPVGTSGDLMKCFKYLEAPGIDKIYGNRPAEKFYKVVASSAYNWDKSIVMSETYGGMGISTDSMYSVAMDQYVKGINQLILHAYWYNNAKEKVTYLPELSERNPIYRKDLPAFSKYLSRMNLLLQNDGSFIADAAILYPINQMQAEHYFDGPLNAYKGGVITPKSDYVEVGRLLSDEIGINFMFLHPEILDERCGVSGNLLTLQSRLHPQRLRVVIVPSCRTILLSNLRKIKEFFDQGGSVIFTTQLPEKSAELGQDKEVKAIIKELISESGMRKNKNGGIALFVPEVNIKSIIAALSSAKLTCFVKFENNEPLRYLHKKLDGKSLVFVTNPGKKAFVGSILLNDNKAYEMWDPYSGSVGTSGAKNEGSGVKVNLKLQPGKSIFVIEK